MASLVPQTLNNAAPQSILGAGSPQPTDQVQQLLSQLQAPIAPEAIGIWPPAIGWWLVVLFTVIALLAAGLYVIKKVKKNFYRKIALKKLKAIEAQDPSQQLFEISSILQQTLLAAYPALRQYMGQLYGADSAQLFSATCTLNKLPQEQQDAMALVVSDQKYAPQNQASIDNILKASRYWINNHRAISAQQIDSILNRPEEATH